MEIASSGEDEYIWVAGSQRALPCRVVLANRHVGGSVGCLVCNNGAEDVKHMLFTCDRAREVWNEHGI